MKAYKKWLNKFSDEHQGDMAYIPGSKEGWRAALEWVKMICKKSHNHYALTSKIAQELEK